MDQRTGEDYERPNERNSRTNDSFTIGEVVKRLRPESPSPLGQPDPLPGAAASDRSSRTRRGTGCLDARYRALRHILPLQDKETSP